MTAVLPHAVATATSPAVGTLVGVEFVGRHEDDGLIAHWAPNTTGSYYIHTRCALTVLQRRPFGASMAICPSCFTADAACGWCGTHCDERLRFDHAHLSGWAARAGGPTCLADGTLRPAPAELRLVNVPVTRGNAERRGPRWMPGVAA
ncbi:hypothetical protein Drose_06565 [Dactylosporangium roseum]|uniref:Uncharacterized protein n=1 Tax=Dactylosporangium roseum TaxID=47989 RepID=A0ABY5ZAB6_9ACTN|nr:hypothetical protein [Dactylosporangium roseum]UWZ37935.1 hypothetical protein Drose_06565 [Dactylosporangium roseum]